MKTFGKLVLVAAVLVALVAGGYLALKSVFGGSEKSAPTAAAADPKGELLKTQVADLRKQLADRKELVAKATKDLKAAAAATSDRERSVYLTTATGYIEMLATALASEEATLKGVQSSVASTTVNSTEAEEMRKTLEALAAQEFETASKSRADLLRKYRK